MLLARGPAAFITDLTAATTRLRRLLAGPTPTSTSRGGEPDVGGSASQQRADQPQQQQTGPPQQQTGQSGAASGQESSAGAGAGQGEDEDEGSATDMMQHRVLLLRALRSRLAVALAQLAEAAGLLRLEGFLTLPAAPAPPARHSGGMSSSWAAAGAEAARRKQQTQQQRLQDVEASVRAAVRGMRAALGTLLAAEAQDGAEPASLAGAAAGTPGHPQALQCGPAPAVASSLASELRALLDVLALRPLAAAALGLPRRQCGQQPAAAAETTAPAEEAEGDGKEGEGKAEEGASAGGKAAAAAAPVERLDLTTGGASARAALDAARRAAALAGPLLPLPASARMPSAWQRHWLRYLAAAALAGCAGLFLLRHSRLAGSDDLDRWLRSAASGVRSALSDHVVAPLAAVRDELFRTFRDRPAIVSPDEFATSRQSLVRMLEAFAADHARHAHAHRPAAAATSAAAEAAAQGAKPDVTAASAAAPEAGVAGQRSEGGGEAGGSEGGGSGAEAAAEAAVAAGMAVLMGCYEEELRRPLRNLVLGDLARALLIQVHHVKVDGQAAMLRLDQLLRANELTAALVAALPALGLSVAAAAGLVRLLSPRAPDPRREAVPSRLAMAALELALGQLARQEAAEAAAGHGQAAAGTATAEELRGLVLYRLYRVYAEVCRLYTPAARRSRVSEWRPLSADLLRLAAPRPAAERLAEHQRIMRTYTVFQR